jgi:hypothetical protein
MLYLLALLVVLVTLAVIARIYPGAPSASLSKTALRAAGFLSVARLTIFWSGLALYTGHSDWRQTVGYGLLIVNSVVELAIAAALTGKRSGSSLLVAAFIVLTSAALGWAWAWLRARASAR